MKKLLLTAFILAAFFVGVRFVEDAPAPDDVTIADPTPPKSFDDGEGGPWIEFGMNEAYAADEWVATLAATDAGSSNTASLTKNRKYTVQCTDCCYKASQSTPVVPDCTKDFLIIGPPIGQNGHRDFDSASRSYVAIRATDGGHITGRLLQRTE